MNTLEANIRNTKTKGDLSSLRELSSPLVFVSLILASNEFIKSRGFSLRSLITQGNYLNKSETDVEFDILFIASAIKAEIDRTSMFLALFVLFLLSIVSVITKFLITEFLIFFTASPLKTP